MNHINYTYETCEKDIKEIVKRIKIIEQERGFKFINVYPIKRGGYYLGLRLSELLGIPIIHNLGKVNKTKTIISEDIVDTGKTLYGLRKCFVVCLHYKSQSKFVPRLYVNKINTYDWMHYFWEEGNVALETEQSVKLLKIYNKR